MSRRYLPLTPPDRISPQASLALFTIVMAVVGLGVSSAHEHILATRDSGSYIATAGWLTESHSLHMEVSHPLFDGVPVAYESVGFPQGPRNDILHPQFMHMFPSLLAIAGSLGELSWMYFVNPAIAAIGLLCLFALSRRLLSTWWAIAVVGLVAASMPFLYFSRAPFSEPLALALTVAGLWVATESIHQRLLTLATGAGLLLGAVSLARIDGVVVLLGLIVFERSAFWEEPDRNKMNYPLWWTEWSR